MIDFFINFKNDLYCGCLKRPRPLKDKFIILFEIIVIIIIIIILLLLLLLQ